jgi:hypothetical protein
MRFGKKPVEFGTKFLDLFISFCYNNPLCFRLIYWYTFGVVYSDSDTLPGW